MNVVSVRNMLNTLKEVYLFFHGSAKRQQLLERMINDMSDSNKHKLKFMQDTMGGTA